MIERDSDEKLVYFQCFLDQVFINFSNMYVTYTKANQNAIKQDINVLQTSIQ